MYLKKSDKKEGLRRGDTSLSLVIGPPSRAAVMNPSVFSQAGQGGKVSEKFFFL